MVALMCWPVIEPGWIAAWFATTAILCGALVIAGRRLYSPSRVAALGPERGLRLHTALSVLFAAVISLADAERLFVSTASGRLQIALTDHIAEQVDLGDERTKETTRAIDGASHQLADYEIAIGL